MSEKWDVGDFFPLHTSMGNIIETEIKGKWTFSNVKGMEWVNWLYDEKAILWFIDELRFRYKNDLKSHILGTGDLGSGKSTCSQIRYRLYKWAMANQNEYKILVNQPHDAWKLSDILDKSRLDMADCCFKLEELRARCMGNKAEPLPGHKRRKFYRPNYYIMDESGKELSSHRWQDKYVEDMKQQLDISRVKLEIIDMNLPHLRGIIKGIRDSNADFLSHTFTYKENGELVRGVVEIREASKDRWEQEIFWKGTLACMFPKLDDDSYYDYMDKKLTYVESQDQDERQDSWERDTLRMIASKHKELDMTIKEFCAFSGISERTAYNLLSERKAELEAIKIQVRDREASADTADI